MLIWLLEQMHLLQALRNQAAKIAADIENSKLFTQMGDRGSFRECIIRDFLRPFLPDCYGLSSGEIFSADGEQSAQVDIVVFDAVFSTILFRNGPHQLFPAESVFGSIEVKSSLTTAELALACNNIASVKRLKRAASDMTDFLPFVRLNMGDEFSWDRTALNPYVGCIFGYRGASADAVVVELNRRIGLDVNNKQFLPDFVFVAQPGYTVLRCKSGPTGAVVVGPGKDFERFMYLETEQDTLPLFFVTLNLCLHQMRLRSIDFVKVWRQLIAGLRGKMSEADA